MRDAAGRSRCFAFLTFDEPASVNAVMVREHFLDGKIVSKKCMNLRMFVTLFSKTWARFLFQIDPKRAIPRQEHQRATKLFIGGLAGSVTSESMREFFSQFGKVIDSTVMLDRETGRSKGFGFVSFEDTNVQPFLGFGNLEIDGKLVCQRRLYKKLFFIDYLYIPLSPHFWQIDVKLAQPRYQRDNFPHEEAAAAAAAGGGGGTDFTQGGAGSGGGGGGGRFVGQQQNFNNGVGPGIGVNPGVGVGGAGAGNTPFDPQALAQLYTRMFQMSGAGGLNPGMMGGMGVGGGMNPMMAGMAAAGGFAGGAGGMRPGMMNMGMGAGMGGGMGNMGRGGAMMGGGGGVNPNIPRGPRGGPGGPGGMGGPGVGPQRTGQRGQHNFHPFAR